MYLNNGVVGYERGDFVILNKSHIYYTMSGFEYAKYPADTEVKILGRADNIVKGDEIIASYWARFPDGIVDRVNAWCLHKA